MCSPTSFGESGDTHSSLLLPAFVKEKLSLTSKMTAILCYMYKDNVLKGKDKTTFYLRFLDYMEGNIQPPGQVSSLDRD